jgi:hypothetical protein
VPQTALTHSDGYCLFSDPNPLGTSRRPQKKLATRFTVRKIGSSPALVPNSSRKWGKHDDWHMFPDVVRGAFYLLFARRKLRDDARRYWYEDRT